MQVLLRHVRLGSFDFGQRASLLLVFEVHFQWYVLMAPSFCNPNNRKLRQAFYWLPPFVSRMLMHLILHEKSLLPYGIGLYLQNPYGLRLQLVLGSAH